MSEQYEKVGIVPGGPMHIERGNRTLCGRRWWFENNLGDTYCRVCQRALAKARLLAAREGK